MGMMSDIENFGVYARNQIPKRKIKKGESGIVNFESTHEGGTHWVAFYNSPEEKHVCYFDSFGIPPDDELYRFLHSTGLDVFYNDSKIQKNTSTKCGYFCMKFIREMLKGKKYSKVMDEFTDHPSDKNEKLAKSSEREHEIDFM